MGATAAKFSDGWLEATRGEAERLYTRANELRARGEEWCQRGEALLRQASALEAEARDLDEILGRAPQLRVDYQDDILRGQALRETAIRILAQQRGVNQPIHYREWYELLRDLGIRAAGKDPLATFLTQINRSPVVERVEERGERSGVYRLNPTRGYREAQQALTQATQGLLAVQKAFATTHAQDSRHLHQELHAAAETLDKAKRKLESVLRERQELLREKIEGIKHDRADVSDGRTPVAARLES